MSFRRAHAVITTAGQWSGGTHEGTVVDAAAGRLTLEWTEPPPVDRRAGPAAPVAALAFDRECRLYRSVPDAGRVERIAWGMHDPLAPPAEAAPVTVLFPAPTTAGPGGVADTEAGPRAFGRPTGLAVDRDDRLFVADAAARRILVFDLWSRRLLHRAAVASRPCDLALDADGRTVWAVCHDPPALVSLTARTEPRDHPSPPDGARRIAAAQDGSLAVLRIDAGGATAIARRALGRGDWADLAYRGRPPSLAGARDLEFLDAATLVVARAPGRPFLRLVHGDEGWEPGTPLLGRGHDGAGIVRTPDGHIAFWTARGPRQAVAAPVRFAPVGRFTTYRLDAGEFQTRWGRLFLDACVPPGTGIRVACATTDEDDRQPARPDDPPPPIPDALAPGREPLTRPVHLRETGREVPWCRPAAGDPVETYEAPLDAPPGRYLWVTLELHGTTGATPWVRSLRAEHPGHDTLSRLPRTYSRDAAAAAFLDRYLAMFDGALGDLDNRSADRHVLLDPRSAPAETLDWLAGFLGLVLDGRWSARVRRRLIAAAADLFRFRGTVRGLERFLELALDIPSGVAILEHWRLRGLDATLGDAASAVVGGGLRVGGAVGADAGATPADPFRTHAHRFSVVIPASLSPERLDMVRHVLAVHRPAHTVAEICTAGTGMRVGRGLRVGLLAVVGRTGGFAEGVVGDMALGRGAVLGRPVPGIRPGAARVGSTARVG